MRSRRVTVALAGLAAAVAFAVAAQDGFTAARRCGGH